MMKLTVLSQRFVRVVTVAIFLACALPFVTYAQGGDLRAIIRAQLLSDPRTSSMTEVQIQSAVDLLAAEAEKQGMTPQDILWRPQVEESFTAQALPEPVSVCGNTADFLCMFNEAFGFAGPDQTIPFVLGAGSMGLVWILAEMIHRRRHPSVSAFAPRSTQ